MTSVSEERAKQAVSKSLRLGLAAVMLLIGCLGGWAAVANISGAVIATGIVVVESSVKTVQHPFGGIIGELRVHEGDQVKTGDVLIRLDETITRAEQAIASKAVVELRARRARLEAERDGYENIVFPSELMEITNDPDVGSRMDGEKRAFEKGRMARNGQKAQLRERIAQLKETIEGYSVRQSAKAEEIQLVERELMGSRELWSKGLLPISKLTALEREKVRLVGEHGQLMSSISEAKGRITETELQILQVDHDLHNEVSKELREAESKIGEQVERKIAAEDRLKRIDIRAPETGRVHQLTVHTVGGVIRPSDPIMTIVPDGDHLTVDVKVSPSDIDQIGVGQAALLRFSAFNQRNTPELHGSLSRISPDIQTEQQTGRPYYSARISVSDEEIQRLGSMKLVPGMPVEAFIHTSERRVASYFLKPITDQMQRAFREE